MTNKTKKILKAATVTGMLVASPVASAIGLGAGALFRHSFKGNQKQRNIVTGAFSLATCGVLGIISAAYTGALVLPAAAAMWWVLHKEPGSTDKDAPKTADKKTKQEKVFYEGSEIADAEFWDEETGKWLSQSRQLVKRG